VTIFLLGEGEDFIMFLLIGQPNEPLEKTKQNKTSKHAPTIKLLWIARRYDHKGI